MSRVDDDLAFYIAHKEDQALIAEYESMPSLIGCKRQHVEEREDERLARVFHETYERLAIEFSYDTRAASAVPWEDVPDNNKQLMIAVCNHILTLWGVFDV